jgi:putative acetyltransferase
MTLDEAAVRVRTMRQNEFDAVCELSMVAFGFDPGIQTLLVELRSSWAWDDDLAFVAELDGQLVGQVLYTHAILDSPDRLVDVLVLSPIAVRTDVQRRGIGGKLISESLEVVSRRREPLVFLEGHPSYYPRFGFRRGAELGFTAPSTRIPDPAFMVYELPAYEPWMTGALVYPDAFWRTDSVGLRSANNP